MARRLSIETIRSRKSMRSQRRAKRDRVAVQPWLFGWIMGGSHPIGVAADMMASDWAERRELCLFAGRATVERSSADGWSIWMIA